jgi:hypothetical protein
VAGGFANAELFRIARCCTATDEKRRGGELLATDKVLYFSIAKLSRDREGSVC